MGQIIEGLKNTKDWFWVEVARFNFIVKAGNTIAHAMAAEGLKSTKDQFWVEDAPLGVIDLAASDRRFIEPP
ncbi:hypothetical protein Goklo_028481 [Gossypium klotzschianum]|uniref:RNase H type-1 domain-containing protein n=1 Tax=Gossypium klotzschianum TaxID=34286 RepID=A0A7J8U1K7_9ROSI|nr:hypothetical protein [Gossypium klotzschianum]